MKRREFLSASAGVAGLLVHGVARSQSKPCPPPAIGVTGGGTTQVSCGSEDLSSWIPAPGTFADVSLNRPSDVNPCPGGGCAYSGTEGQSGVFEDWTSGVFAPELGALGSYVCWGGGHKGYAGNEVYRWDVESRLWMRMGNPSSFSDAPGNIAADGSFPDGKPAAPHTYHTLGIRDSVYGGGPNGSLIQATLPACDANGNGRSGAWWQFNFATATWSKFVDSSGVSAGTLGFKTMIQEPNGHCWWFGGGYLSNIARITQSGAISKYNVSVNSGNYFSGGIVSPRIAVLNGEFGRGTELRLINLAAVEAGGSDANVWKSPNVTGTPAGGAHGLRWCPELGRFAAMDGASPTKIYWLVPPPDPWTGTWTWLAETMAASGGAVPRTLVNGSHGRFVWCPTIRCFLWATAARLPMQAYRPRGT